MAKTTKGRDFGGLPHNSLDQLYRRRKPTTEARRILELVSKMFRERKENFPQGLKPQIFRGFDWHG
jgi:hypothetical protein